MNYQPTPTVAEIRQAADAAERRGLWSYAGLLRVWANGLEVNR